ncbi:hypothetical protein ACFLV0_05335 [Chloroflexota bacterium]
MTDSRTIHIAGVGPILFERSKRTRRVIISVKPSKGVLGQIRKAAEERPIGVNVDFGKLGGSGGKGL